MKVLDLFSGSGMFSYGLEKAGMETVAFCEFEKYPQKILKQWWPDIPIYDDVRTLTYGKLKADGNGRIDVICGGFPCTDISVAGKQEGIGSETRSGLWSECARLLGEIRPRYAIFENVTALLSGDNGDWVKRVLWDISQVGYDAQWHCISASELGAHHHRDRIWIIAYPSKQRCDNGANNRKERHFQNNKERQPSEIQQQGNKRQSRPSSPCEILSDSLRQGLQRYREFGCSVESLRKPPKSRFGTSGEKYREKPSWESEPRLGRVADGVPNRSHRLKMIGNGVFWPIPYLIGRAIMEVENDNPLP